MSKLIIDALALERGKNYGYQEFLFNLLSFFNAERSSLLFEEIYLFVLDSQVDFLEKEFPKIKTKGISVSGVFDRLLKQNKISKLFNLSEEDVILYTYNYCSFRKQIAKEVLVVHDLLFRRKDLFFSSKMRFQRYLYIPLSLKRANRIIAISETTANDIQKFYGSKDHDITVIRNYFKFEKYIKTEDNSIGNYFLSICSSQPHKNTLSLLKAFELYCKKGGRNNLTLVGAIFGNSEIEAYYNELANDIKNRITVVSRISNEELSQWYSHACGFVSASLFEGLGMPIVEAMYFELPLVLSDIPIFHEISGEKADFFPPLDIELLCEKLLSNKPQRIDYGPLLSELFSVENTSQKYVTLLNSLL